MELKTGPWGGGNQFLKALKKESIRANTYEDSIEKADIVLFNSHHDPQKVLRLRAQYKDHLFVHRVDGPMSYRGRTGVNLDKKIFYLNSLVADGTVFQSKWSRNQTLLEGLTFSASNTVIINAPDPEIFYEKEEENLSFKDRRIKLISSSWSANKMKGSEFFSYLDKNLDFDKFSLSFAGNINNSFTNIKLLGQLSSIHLAAELRKHDIFIFASEREACSNSLLEALHTGLPVVCRNSSSNPEVLGEGGALFDDNLDMLNQITSVSRDYQKYKEKIKVLTISEVHDAYINFFNSLQVLDRKKTKYLKEKIKFKLGLI